MTSCQEYILVGRAREINEGTWTAPKSRNTAGGVGPQPSDTYTHMHIHNHNPVTYIHMHTCTYTPHTMSFMYMPD